MIETFDKIADHLAKRIQRILQCLKLTDDRRWTPSDGKISHGFSWPCGIISTIEHLLIYKAVQESMQGTSTHTGTFDKLS
jgi:hypothetical protein